MNVRMKQVFSSMGGILIGIYFLSCSIFVPLFNYRYARENGFVKWLFFGEFVATGKGIAWPYFLFFDSRMESLNNQDKDIKMFLLALERSQEATRIINSGEAFSRISEPDMKRVLQYEKDALAYGKLVDINHLNLIYASLGDNFQNKFISGLSFFVDGHEENSVDKILEGQKLKDQWDDWYLGNIARIKDALKL